MELDVMQLITEGGSLGLLALVLWKFNQHITNMMASHREDRISWLEALHRIVEKLTGIEDNIERIENDLKKIEEKI